MGFMDYCAAGHWDEDSQHDCTVEDGAVEQLHRWGWLMAVNSVYEVFDHEVVVVSFQEMDVRAWDRTPRPDQIFELETGLRAGWFE